MQNLTQVDNIKKYDQKKKIQRLMGWTIVAILIISIVIITIFPSTKLGNIVNAKQLKYEKQPALGSKDAPIKIVEFADFKCPSCKEFDQKILPELRKDFIDNKIVQYYFINYPIISQDSRTAAMASEAVYSQNPEEFWKYYDAIFTYQRNEHINWATSDYLVQIAKQSNIQVDYDKLKKDINNKIFVQAVKDDEAIGKKLGVNSTPTIYINGEKVSSKDTFNYSALKALIIKKLGETKK